MSTGPAGLLVSEYLKSAMKYELEVTCDIIVGVGTEDYGEPRECTSLSAVSSTKLRFRIDHRTSNFTVDA